MDKEIIDELVKIFEYLGFDNKSVQFYLSCLKAGKTTINEISKDINVPRSTCYLILEKLTKEGIIFETPFGRKRTLVAMEPQNLINILKNKSEESQNTYSLAKEILPKLNSISPFSKRPKVRFYEGFESIKQIYLEILEEAKEISVFCLMQPTDQVVLDFLHNRFLNKVIKKGIKTCEIVSDTKKDFEYIKKYSTPINKIVQISKEFNTDTDYMIWNDKVAFISYGTNIPVGIIIEDKEIVKFEKMRFKLLWQSIAIQNGQFKK